MLLDTIPLSSAMPLDRLAAVVFAMALAVVAMVKTREPLVVVAALLYSLHWADFLPGPWDTFVSFTATATLLVGLQRALTEMRRERTLATMTAPAAPAPPPRPGA